MPMTGQQFFEMFTKQPTANDGPYAPEQAQAPAPNGAFQPSPGQRQLPNGYYGGYQDPGGVRHPGNEPGMAYMMSNPGQTTQPMPTRSGQPWENPGFASPGQGGGNPNEFAGMSDWDRQIAQTLRQRYGANFDINDPERGLPYFQRRAAESQAEGDGRDLNYWTTRANGSVEAEHAAQMAQNGSGYGNGIIGAGMAALGGVNGLANYSAPGLLAPWTQEFKSPGDFKAPTLGDLEQNPGYQARLKLGEEAAGRSAAANGTLLTGGFQKDLNDYAQAYATNEYDKVYGRAADENDRSYGRALGEYQQNYGIFTGNQNNTFNKLFSLSQLGLSAAGGAAGAGSSYGGNVGNAYNNANNIDAGQGNAGAAAAINRGNNNSAAAGSIGNDAVQAAFYPSQSQSGRNPAAANPRLSVTSPIDYSRLGRRVPLSAL